MADETSEQREYGGMMRLKAPLLYQDIVRQLQDSAHAALPDGTRYEIRMADLYGSTDFDRRMLAPDHEPAWALCWYRHLGFAHIGQWTHFQVSSFGDALQLWVAELGCYRVARQRTYSSRLDFDARYALNETERIPMLDEEYITYD